MQLAQAVGNIAERERSILEVDSAAQPRIHPWTVRLNLEGGVSAGGQIRVQRFGDLQVDRSVGGKIQLVVLFERQTALRMRSVSSPVTCNGSR